MLKQSRMSKGWTPGRFQLICTVMALLLTLLPTASSPTIAAPPFAETLADSAAGKVSAAVALDSGTISTSPGAAYVLLGGTADVDLRIDSVVSIYGADLRLCYDSALVSIVPAIDVANAATLRWDVFHPVFHSVLFNAIMDPIPEWCPCSSLKWYMYVVNNLNPATAFTGSGRFATLKFQGDAIGTSALHFCYTKASDRDGGNLNSASVDGSITVVYGRLGSMVWDDLDKDGYQDAGEPGVPNVTVKLLNGSGNPVLDPGGNPITTQTAADGSFELTNMPAGTYIVEFVKPANYVFTAYNADSLGLTGTANSDADRTTGRTVAFTLSSPYPQVYIDAGLVAVPTVASVHGVRAYVDSGNVIVGWETAVEVGTLGFHLQRLDETTGEYVTVNERLIPAVGSARGASYRVVDGTAVAGRKYTYQVVEVEPAGGTFTYGPFAITAAGEGESVSGQYLAEPHPVTSEQVVRGAASLAEATQARLLRASAPRDSRLAEGMNSPAESEPALKILVRRAGLYYLSAARIASAMGTTAAQVESWLRSDDLALSNRGHNVAYLVAPNRSGLYFYGQGLDSFYSTDNVYWLGRGDGHTMDVVRGKVPKGGESSGSFVQKVHTEENRLAIPAAFSDPEADYWMWDMLWAGATGRDSAEYAFPAPGVTSGSGSLTLHVLGYSDTPADLDHHVVVTLNGHELGQSRWDGVKALDLQLTVDAGWLHEEDNRLSVRSVLDEGLAYSAFYVNSFDLSYPRRYRAVDNVLELRGDANELIKVDGFTRQAIWVFDITDPIEPRQVQSAKVLRSGGSYQVVFAPESRDSTYLVMTPDRALAPDAVLLDSPSNLKDEANDAEYVIITPSQFKPGAEALAAYRRTQGLSSMVIDLVDIYDEFNQGLASPTAIRSFLQYAYDQWQQKPRYVLLAGEGNYDYKDNLGLGGNLIPVWMIGTSRGLFPADNRFADVRGNDGVPDMAIGRLPVATTAELDAAVAKIMAYEQAPGVGWSDQVLLLADNADDGGDFATDSRFLETMLPNSDSKTIIALGELPLSSAREQLFAALHSGVGLFNYLGHGGLDRLAAEGLLTSQDMPSLDNDERLPIAALMTCAVGQFAIPGFDSLAEQLVRGPGGAAAAWSPTGWALNGHSRELDAAFVQALRGPAQVRLGDAVVEALGNYARLGHDPALLDLFDLLGDPAMMVK